MTKKPRSAAHQAHDGKQQEKPETHSNTEEVEKYKDLYLRALADYKNLEHRMNQERQRMRGLIKREMIYTFLPVLDNLDQAEVFNQDPGLKMISSAFRKALNEMGVVELNLVGTEYDPAYAEVVEVIPGDEDNIVQETMQKAYQLDGQVIRPGKVKVSKTE